MDDSESVRGFDGFRDLARDVESFIERNGTLRDPLGKRQTFDELENQRGRITTVFEPVDLRDVRMVQRREHFGFSLKPRKPLRIPDERRGQNFQRDVAVELRVASAIDLARPTHTNGRNDFVRSEARASNECHRRQVLYRL